MSVQQRTAADVYAFLGMLFRGYREAIINPSAVDQVDISHIRDDVRKATESVKEKPLPLPTPHMNGNGLTQESWEECLNYYEVRMERLMENTPYDMDKIVKLELWFLRLIEPITGDVDAWKRREMYKCEHYHTIYLPPPLHSLVSKAIQAKLGNTAFIRVMRSRIAEMLVHHSKIAHC